MPITPLPTPPSRTSPSTFSALGDAFVAAMPTFATEANALEANVNAKEATVVADEVICTAAAAVALAASNYKGPWSSQSGAANVPYAVSHNGSYWQLTTNLADVTAKEPGVDSEWLLIATGTQWQRITSATDAVKGNGYLVDTSAGSVTLTLPASPSEGDVVEFADDAGTFATNKLVFGRNGNKIMGLAEDMDVTTNYASGKLVYSGAANGWRV